MNDFSNMNRVHMIGVGGIGMSALARLFLHEGKQVSGSDKTPSDITRALEAEGLSFYEQQNSTSIYDSGTGIELVVYTEAMPKDHPEMEAARKLGVPVVNYFDALATVANEYYLIVVAGTHGKSTTTAMLIDMLEDVGFDPTAIVGSLRGRTGSNFRAGHSKYFVVEACEWRDDFKSFEPDVLVITNVEHEHVDYYPTLADVQRAFATLAAKVPAEGAIIAHAADPQIKPVLEGVSAKVIDYKQYLDVSMPMLQPGLHNRMDAAAAIGAATFLGIDTDAAKQTASEFTGIWRRFEYKGKVNDAPVYDDYAHHPTEIRAAISGAREKHSDKKLTVVFQPHTYSRTAAFLEEFSEALGAADHVVMLPIYAAREENESGVSSEQIVDLLREQGTDAVLRDTIDDAVVHVRDSVGADDVVLVLGAGDVTKVASVLVA